MTAGEMPKKSPISRPAWVLCLLALGLYLSFRGYHSRDGDQAYRLPLLLHIQDPSLYPGDPFIRSLDEFNPHRGYLSLLDAASRPLGLSFGVFALFAATFWSTCYGIDRIAKIIDRDSVGLVAVGLILTAKAGNVGTNHLFESMLLDRLIALALGWNAIAFALEGTTRRANLSAFLIGLAAIVHPGLGLQMAMLLAASWVVWAFMERTSGISRGLATRHIIMIALWLSPAAALMGRNASSLFDGLPPEEFRAIGVELQMPQHMLPHLWRMPQWLAWASYFVLAGLAILPIPRRRGADVSVPSGAKIRLIVMLAVNLAALGLAWIAVEPFHDVRATVFQPFRMATVARGLALILLAGRVDALWSRGDAMARTRAALIVVGLIGDWSMVLACLVECAATIGELSDWTRVALPAAVFSACCWFLGQHDTESGHHRIILVVATVLAASWLPAGLTGWTWTRRRKALALTGAWLIPAAAALTQSIPTETRLAKTLEPLTKSLAGRCRFGSRPVDDVECLAAWCDENTPRTARFIGPPGPKTFRLWSRRSLAFNRAASPYHAAGLADWATRYRDHVGFSGTNTEFVLAYYADRHGLEKRYQAMTDPEKAELARRQGADHVIAARPIGPDRGGPLEWLHTEGNYAVYRVRPKPVDDLIPIETQPAQTADDATETASAGTG